MTPLTFLMIIILNLTLFTPKNRPTQPFRTKNHFNRINQNVQIRISNTTYLAIAVDFVMKVYIHHSINKLIIEMQNLRNCM